MLNDAGVEGVAEWLFQKGYSRAVAPVLANYLLMPPSAELDEELGDLLSLWQWNYVAENDTYLRREAASHYVGNADGEPFFPPGTDHLEPESDEGDGEEDEDEEGHEEDEDGGDEFDGEFEGEDAGDDGDEGGGFVGLDDGGDGEGEMGAQRGENDEDQIQIDGEVEHVHEYEEQVRDEEYIEEAVEGIEEDADIGLGDAALAIADAVARDPVYQQLAAAGNGPALQCRIIDMQEFFRLVEESVNEAETAINQGPARMRDWCQAQAAGERVGVTNAMADGTRKHNEAERRLRNKLAGIRLSGGFEVKVEATYAWRQERGGRPAYRGVNVVEANTIRPDIVIHSPGDPTAVQMIIDFKFPCPISNEARPGTSQHADFRGLSQDVVYMAILSPPSGMFLLSPGKGYRQL